MATDPRVVVERWTEIWNSGAVEHVAELVSDPCVRHAPAHHQLGQARCLGNGVSGRGIVDPEAVPFPGFDGVRIGYAELQTMVKDSRYAAWQTALGSVRGIYLIADTSTGHLYVGEADGGERILGRWSQYAQDGHGGNKALRELAGSDAEHRRHFQFSLLRVFGPSTPTAEIDAAEAHWKRALLS